MEELRRLPHTPSSSRRDRDPELAAERRAKIAQRSEIDNFLVWHHFITDRYSVSEEGAPRVGHTAADALDVEAQSSGQAVPPTMRFSVGRFWEDLDGLRHYRCSLLIPVPQANPILVRMIAAPSASVRVSQNSEELCSSGVKT